MDILTGAAASVISSNIIVPLIEQIQDVICLDENRRLLQDQLNRMKGLLCDISYEFYGQQKTPPQSLINCLARMDGAVGMARELISRSQRSHQCIGIDCAFLWKPILSRQIKKCNTTFDGLFDELQKDISVYCSAQQIASFTPRQAEMKIGSWLTEAPQVRRIGVYGPSGVGKTTLLKKMYSTQKVNDVFDNVIWVTVAHCTIVELQGRIASEVNLDLAEVDVDLGRMMLSAYLKPKKFFLVLEDMWTTLDLQQLGVELNKDSKLIFSTCNRNLIEEMKPEERIELQAMSTDEGWDLFSKVAFKDEGGNVPEDIEPIARLVSRECKGLPLAINLIASSMIGKRAVNEWELALIQLQRPDFIKPIDHHPRIDRGLFRRLRWSYYCLPDVNLKHCFLFTAMFPQDTVFLVKSLVQMWIAEGLVTTKDIGQRYVKILENRYLFQLKPPEKGITVHDAVRDMAVYIGETEEKCIFRAGQMLQDFPHTEMDCKRISVSGNNIKSLPAQELRCPNLVTLFIGKLELEEIPEAFLRGLTSLKVLDISGTPLRSLPSSLWELRQLEFLNLSWTEIEILPDGIGSLSSLQFLNLNHCMKLKKLPSHQIGKLTSLKYIDVSYCNNLKLTLKEITKIDCEEIVRKGVRSS